MIGRLSSEFSLNQVLRLIEHAQALPRLDIGVF
jgi:hypothetical protein